MFIEINFALNREAIMPQGSAAEGPAKSPIAVPPSPPFAANSAVEYCIDAWQRSILLLDTLRRRGNNYLEHNAREVPHVLNFTAELVLDGRSLPRPVNYALARIVPPRDTPIDPRKRPFIVFDPRAGHGPGIGGMKHDSEIGVALRAGHPCNFVGFLPEPMAGQTIEDVCAAEVRFVAEVAAWHPDHRPRRRRRKPRLVLGDYLFGLERGGLDDIRALGSTTPADDLAFATVARVSGINQGLYRTFLGPVVSAGVTGAGAELAGFTQIGSGFACSPTTTR